MLADVCLHKRHPKQRCNCRGFVQEDFSDEEDGGDEDLSAALATLRMRQEARTKEGGGQGDRGKGGSSVASVDGATGVPQETSIITQVCYSMVCASFSSMLVDLYALHV